MRQYNRYKDDRSVQVFDTFIKALCFLLSWPIKRFIMVKDRGVKVDKIANLQKWVEMEKLLESGDEIHARQAVVEADKFFDEVMRKLGASGEKFADRLRSLENRFNHNVYQSIWEAHKVRNQISHEIDRRLRVEEAKSVLYKFRRGLENIGAL